MAELVDLFIAGVQKAGTTALFEYVRDWPTIAAPAHKELHFFDDESVDWRCPDYGRMHRAYPPADGRMRIEATPISIYWPPSLGRIRVYNPAAKLVFIFREPCDRALSQWKMEYRKGNDSRDFSRAIREPTPDQPRLGYLERGMYAAQLQRALALFPREQMLLVRSVDLAEDPTETLRAFAMFAGLPPPPPTHRKAENVGPEGGMSGADRDFLISYFAEDQRRFTLLTGLHL